MRGEAFWTPSSSSGLGSPSRPPSSFLCLLPLPPDALALLLFFLDFFTPRAAVSPFLLDHCSARQPGVGRCIYLQQTALLGGEHELGSCWDWQVELVLDVQPSPYRPPHWGPLGPLEASEFAACHSVPGFSASYPPCPI